MEDNKKLSNEEFIEKYYNKDSKLKKAEEELDKMLEDFKNELNKKEDSLHK